MRLPLAGSLLWVGALKFVEYEAEQIQPMVSTSPLFSRINRVLGSRKIAGLIGITEITRGALIAARPLSPKASALGSIGATAIFLTAPSFMLSMPGVLQEEHGFPALSMEGQFLAKDGVLLGAAIVTAAESNFWMRFLDNIDFTSMTTRTVLTGTTWLAGQLNNLMALER